MKDFKQRLLAIFCMIAMSVCGAMAQTSSVTHIVDRGETLASIAQRYSTTEAKIVELNPDAAQFVYVGMELMIPVTAARETSNTTVNTNKTSTSSGYYQPTESSSQYDYFEGSRVRPSFDLGFGFLNKPKGYSSAFTSEITAGANYMVTTNFYFGGRVGYNSSNTKRPGEDISLNFLMIPLETGYVFASKDRKFCLIPFMGFDFNFGLSGKKKYSSSSSDKVDIGGDVGVAFKVGAHIFICNLTISGAYHIPINDNQKLFFGSDAYPVISIGGFL